VAYDVAGNLEAGGRRLKEELAGLGA
jgi:hypothetical protein